MSGRATARLWCKHRAWDNCGQCSTKIAGTLHCTKNGTWGRVCSVCKKLFVYRSLQNQCSRGIMVFSKAFRTCDSIGQIPFAGSKAGFDERNVPSISRGNCEGSAFNVPRTSRGAAQCSVNIARPYQDPVLLRGSLVRGHGNLLSFLNALTPECSRLIVGLVSRAEAGLRDAQFWQCGKVAGKDESNPAGSSQNVPSTSWMEVGFWSMNVPSTSRGAFPRLPMFREHRGDSSNVPRTSWRNRLQQHDCM